VHRQIASATFAKDNIAMNFNVVGSTEAPTARITISSGIAGEILFRQHAIAVLVKAIKQSRRPFKLTLWHLAVPVGVFAPQHFLESDPRPGLLIPRLAETRFGDKQNDEYTNQKMLHEDLTWPLETLL
jgi:hypothetical protein